MINFEELAKRVEGGDELTEQELIAIREILYPNSIMYPHDVKAVMKNNTNAVLNLVPDGWAATISYTISQSRVTIEQTNWTGLYEGISTTPERAIIAALIRMKGAENETN